MGYKNETSEMLYITTLLYASETWVLKAETEGRINSLEIHRRMLKISYQQHISNEDI